LARLAETKEPVTLQSACRVSQCRLRYSLYSYLLR